MSEAAQIVSLEVKYKATILLNNKNNYISDFEALPTLKLGNTLEISDLDSWACPSYTSHRFRRILGVLLLETRTSGHFILSNTRNTR